MKQRLELVRGYCTYYLIDYQLTEQRSSKDQDTASSKATIGRLVLGHFPSRTATRLPLQAQPVTS